jgi:DNA-binding SARP family transcriptional activator
MAMVRTSSGGWRVDVEIVAPGPCSLLGAQLRAWSPTAAIDHNPSMRQQPNLRVQVLGVLAVAVDGREVPVHELASRKGRTLLKLLLARRDSVVPADVLAEALWEGRPPADPHANLATLVSRLRAVLGPEAIASERQGWRFVAGARVEIDLEEAERLAGEAEARLAGQPSLALATAERALALLGRGPFLADEPDADWAMPARREADRLGARARRLAWEAALAVGDPTRALAHARAATEADPLDEVRLARRHARPRRRRRARRRPGRLRAAPPDLGRGARHRPFPPDELPPPHHPPRHPGGGGCGGA